MVPLGQIPAFPLPRQLVREQRRCSGKIVGPGDSGEQFRPVPLRYSDGAERTGFGLLVEQRPREVQEHARKLTGHAPHHVSPTA